MNDHALLNPSGADIWGTCTLSARYGQNEPGTNSESAQEGSLAHDLSELLIKEALQLVSKVKLKQQRDLIEKSKFYKTEMLRYCEAYRDFVLEQYSEAIALDPHAEILLEQRINLRDWAPESFGRGDVVILALNRGYFIDLKYGMGKFVECEGNRQIRMYALGVYSEHNMVYDLREIVTTIYQPRMNNISTVVVSVDELLKWGEEWLKPVALKAWNGEGEFIAGSHCKYCKAVVKCPAKRDYSLQMDRHRYTLGDKLTDEAIADALTMGAALKDWVNAVEEYVLKHALKGRVFPGWKVVTGRSMRVYTDEEKVAAATLAAGLKEEDIYNKKIVGIGKMEELLGKIKFQEVLGDLVHKPPGAPTLKEDADSRPAYRSAAADFADDFIE